MSAFADLDPVLAHNKERFDRLLRLKRVLAVAAVPALTAVAVLSPASYRTFMVMGLFGAIALVFAALEVARFAIFRQDLRERQGDHTTEQR